MAKKPTPPSLRDAQLAADRVRFLAPVDGLAKLHRLNHYGHLASIADSHGDAATAAKLRAWVEQARGYTPDRHRALAARVLGDDDP